VQRAASLVLAALLLAGCSVSQASGGAPDEDLAGEAIVGEWELVSGTAAGSPLPQPAGARATLQLEGARAGGTSFCNSWSSGYTVEGTALRFGEIGATEMGCEPEVMTAEAAFLTALATVATAALDGPDLLLTGEDVELRFRLVPPVPAGALTGTEWVLDTVLAGELASSTVGRSTLRLADDGTLIGRTACSRLSGRWQRTGDRMVFPELADEPVDCPEDARGQDAHELAVMGDGVTVTIEEDRLTLLADDGRGLVYRAGG
jgi:heat shock protein HslJ